MEPVGPLPQAAAAAVDDNPLKAALRDVDGLCHRWLLPRLPPWTVDGDGGGGGGCGATTAAAATAAAYAPLRISRAGLSAAGTLTGSMRYWTPAPRGQGGEEGEEHGGEEEAKMDETGVHVSFLVRFVRKECERGGEGGRRCWAEGWEGGTAAAWAAASVAAAVPAGGRQVPWGPPCASHRRFWLAACMGPPC